MVFCNFIRVLRNIFMVLAGAVILFLLCISFSVDIGLKIDRYNERYYGEQYSDIQPGVYLYQRVAIPYYQNNTSKMQQNSCDFYETRLRIATSFDLEIQSERPYYNRIPCQDVSPFYESFITERHRSLLPSYSCHIVFAIANSDLTAARFINAVYELRDMNSQNCISENVDLVLDSQFNPETHHFKAPLDNIWQQTIIRELRHSICDPSSCDLDNFENSTILGDLSFDCTSAQCAHVTDSISQSVGIISPLIVSNKEAMSYYPCMPQVDVYHMIKVPVCQPEVIETKGNKDKMISYTSCSNPYLINTENQEKWQEKSRNIVNGIKLETS
jgi:hypothetical protein